VWVEMWDCHVVVDIGSISGALALEPVPTRHALLLVGTKRQLGGDARRCRMRRKGIGEQRALRGAVVRCGGNGGGQKARQGETRTRWEGANGGEMDRVECGMASVLCRDLFLGLGSDDAGDLRFNGAAASQIPRGRRRAPRRPNRACSATAARVAAFSTAVLRVASWPSGERR
jgi:hypothetical protein